ncbi:MAG: hypothetical protein Q7K57_43980 [Burkholderiaceae bacterium]|nr:hypothetical protein [Burkholderiaceae bacterium]
MRQTTTSSCGCSKSSNPEIATYYIDKMDSKNEVALIRQSLDALNGVSGLEFDLKNRVLTVSHTFLNLDQLEAALADIGRHWHACPMRVRNERTVVGGVDTPGTAPTGDKQCTG